MVCAGLENLTRTDILGILAYPNTCDYYFYAKILGAIFIILTLILSFKEWDRYTKPDLISCLGVSALATIFIALIGTLLTIIQPDVFILAFVLGAVFIIIWIIKG